MVGEDFLLKWEVIKDTWERRRREKNLVDFSSNVSERRKRFFPLFVQCRRHSLSFLVSFHMIGILRSSCLCLGHGAACNAVLGHSGIWQFRAFVDATAPDHCLHASSAIAEGGRRALSRNKHGWHGMRLLLLLLASPPSPKSPLLDGTIWKQCCPKRPRELFSIRRVHGKYSSCAQKREHFPSSPKLTTHGGRKKDV